MAITDDLLERRLTMADIAGGLALSEEAGWNQTTRDWELMLQQGTGFGIESRCGALVASALVLPHGDRLAWISMVLVTESYRKRGLATHLLTVCIDFLSAHSLLPLLDATEAGRIVYAKIGFNSLYGLQRLLRKDDPQQPVSAPRPDDLEARPIRLSELDAVIEMDQKIFGADRSAVLRHLLQRQPDKALLTMRKGQITGYVMARDGRQAFHLGPLVAEDAETAKELIVQALNDLQGPVYIDAMNRHSGFQSWLTQSGFAVQRSFTRMVMGDPVRFDHTGRIFASVGPELG